MPLPSEETAQTLVAHDSSEDNTIQSPSDLEEISTKIPGEWGHLEEEDAVRIPKTLQELYEAARSVAGEQIDSYYAALARRRNAAQEVLSMTPGIDRDAAHNWLMNPGNEDGPYYWGPNNKINEARQILQLQLEQNGFIGERLNDIMRAIDKGIAGPSNVVGRVSSNWVNPDTIGQCFD